MIPAHPFAPLFNARTAHARLEPAVRAIWGERVELERCEVLHVWRKTHQRASSAARSYARVSFRLDLRDRDSNAWCTRLAHGLVRFDGEDVSLDLRPFPDDAALPQLQALAQSERALREAPAAVREHCDGSGDAVVQVINYRPGLRCTLRIAARHAAYAKTFADDSGAVLADRMEHLQPVLCGAGSAPAMPSLLAYHAETRTVWCAEVPATNPFLPAPARRSISRAPWRSLGGVLATLHHAGLAGLPILDRARRLHEVEKKVAKLESAARGFGARARAVLDHCAYRVRSLPAGDAVALHADLHTRQIGERDGHAVLFDFDELSRGPAAQDIASLRVDLEAQGIMNLPARRALQLLMAGYVSAGGSWPAPAELDWHYRLQWLDRAYRDWWRHDAGATGRIARALRRAERGL